MTASARRRYISAATAVLLLAAFFRLVDVTGVPPGLSQDEVLNGDIVTFIWQGKHALFFREGFGHEPLYHYWAALFRPLLGDNVIGLRFPSVILALFLVAATTRWLQREAGPAIALFAAFLLATLWWGIIFGRTGLRPILYPLFLVGAAWFWPRDVRRPGRPGVAGLLLGLSLYTYTAARVIFLLPLLEGILVALTAPAPQRWSRLRPRLVILGVTVAVYLPLYLTLRADPTLQQRVDQLAGPLEALLSGDWRPILTSTVATLGVFGLTGDPRWTYQLPGRPLFDPLTAILFVAGLSLAIGTLRRPLPRLALAWLAVTFIPAAITPQAPSIIRLIGALPVAVYFPALGAVTLWRWAARRRPSLLQPLAVGFLALAAFTAARTWQLGFIAWPASVETRLRYQTVFRDMAAYMRPLADETRVLGDAFYEPIDHDSVRRNLGRPLDARWVQGGRALVFPGGSASLYLEPEIAPAVAPLVAASLTEPPRFRSDGRPAFTVWRARPPDLISLPAPVDFGAALRLLSCRQEATPDERRLLSYWEVLAPLPADIAVFVHHVDVAGALVAQADAFDAAAERLQPGDTILQYHALPVVETAVGERIGIYRRGDGRRLPPAGLTTDYLPLLTTPDLCR